MSTRTALPLACPRTNTTKTGACSKLVSHLQRRCLMGTVCPNPSHPADSQQNGRLSPSSWKGRQAERGWENTHSSLDCILLSQLAALETICRTVFLANNQRGGNEPAYELSCWCSSVCRSKCYFKYSLCQNHPLPPPMLHFEGTLELTVIHPSAHLYSAFNLRGWILQQSLTPEIPRASASLKRRENVPTGPYVGKT